MLAYRTLFNEDGELLLDRDTVTALAGEIDEALRIIKTAYPGVPDVGARWNYVPGAMTLGLDLTFAETLDPAMWDNDFWPPISFGREDLDSLNPRLGLRALLYPWRYSSAWIGLCLDNFVNIPAAVRAYRSIPVVQYADPVWLPGDSPDIAVRKVGETWYVVFRDAFGDCPAGCIGQRLYYFTEQDGEARQFDESEALANSVFGPLAETWGAQRLPRSLPPTGGSP
ncbi:MAG: hypothetical protein HYY03_06260 [Chloroflexi bacterium]|nr:hypothetical protein [Chloroflexota bacterium]